MKEIKILIFALSFSSFSLFSESIKDRFSQVSDFTSRPSFYAEGSPFLVDRNELVYMGKTMVTDVPGLHFYEVKTKERIFLAPPIREYFKENPELLIPGTLELISDFLPVNIADLIFLDRKTGKAGFHIETSHYQLPVSKYFFAVWDIKSNKIEFIKELNSLDSSNSDSYSMTLQIGYDTDKEEAYFTHAVDRSIKDKESDDVEVQIFKYAKGDLRSLRKYDSKWVPYNNIAHFPKGKILIQSYAEVHEKVPPVGQLYDIKSGELMEISIPVVSYGAVFSSNGDKIYLASGQTGELRVYDSNTGKVNQKSKLGTHGHVMGFWKENELAWVRNSGIHVYDPVTLKQKKVIPTSKYFKGNVNVSGSLVIPYTSIVIRNGFEGPGDAVGFLLLE